MRRFADIARLDHIGGEPQFPPYLIRDIEDLIIARRLPLTRKLERALRCILENPVDAAFLSMRGLAAKAQVSSATVSRLHVIFGFTHHRDFREVFRRHLRWRNDRFQKHKDRKCRDSVQQ